MKVKYTKEIDKNDGTDLIAKFIFITFLLCFILIFLTKNFIFLAISFIIGGTGFFIILLKIFGKELGIFLLFPLAFVLTGVGLVISFLGEYFYPPDALINRITIPITFVVMILGTGLCITIPCIQKLIAYIKYETIEAKVLDNEQYNFKLYKPTFEYTYKGITYKYKESKYASYYAGLQKGDTVKLKVNPEEPEDVIYRNFSDLLLLLLGILFTYGGIVLLIQTIKEFL